MQPVTIRVHHDHQPDEVIDLVNDALLRAGSPLRFIDDGMPYEGLIYYDLKDTSEDN